ncbi:MAG: HD domain-containing protein [Candidatus Izemoplasmatales bacterium]|jgi:uncharacterized protein
MNLLSEDQLAIVKTTEQFVKRLLNDDSTGHDFHHIMRVRSLALSIAKSFKANLFIIEMAALLHDVDDPKLVKKNDSQRVQSFLSDFANPYIPVSEILEIIANLSFSSYLKGHSESTIEGKIVQDADRLDALGAIGIARTFAFGGSRHRPLYDNSITDDSSLAHFYQKLLKLPDLMNTMTAKRIATKRVKFMKRYLRVFYQEWQVENKI